MSRERICFPAKDLYLPFVQLDIRETQFLLGAMALENHSALFRRALEEFDMPYEIMGGIPEAKGDGYRLVGAGIGKFDGSSFLVRHNGRSEQYNLGTDWSRLSLISQYAPGITFRSVWGGEKCDSDEEDDGR